MSETAKPKSPSHIAYQVRESREGDSFFNRVGAAFPHKDGQGFNIELDAMPVDGRVTLRTPKERIEERKEQEAQKEKPRGARRYGRRSRSDYERE